MIRLVAIDIDDTLINSKQEITAENMQAISLARSKGIVVMLATGRMHIAAMPFAKQLEMQDHELLISYNGAMISQIDGTLIDHIALEQNVALEVIRYCEKHNLTLNTYYNDQLYVQKIDENIIDYCKMVQVEATAVGDLAEYLTKGNKPFSKMLIISDEPDIAVRLPKIQGLLGDLAQVTRSKSNFVEITHPNATKGLALARLAQRMGLKAEQVMAIGDSGNDLSMIAYAGVGVAMGNASQEVQQIADYVTGTHEESGVARALYKFT